MKSKTIVRISAVIVALVVLFGFLFSALVFTKFKIRAIAPPPSPRKVFGQSAAVSAPATSARGMCTMDLASGRVFYEQNADARLPMASTTKIVTAITVIEQYAELGKSLDEKIKISDKAVGVEGTSIYLQKGEQLTARELLFGLMLRSGNDAAAALALSLKPSVAEFAALMNQTAVRAGAQNSSFKNPHGLDEEGHYTTARDLAKITAYAMKNPIFAEIVKTQQANADGVKYSRVFHNKNRLLRTLTGCVGVKTGFTKKAGRCYVGALNSKDRTVICVVLNCGPMFEEASALMTAASEQFPMRRLITTDEFINFTNGCADNKKEDGKDCADNCCEDEICAIAVEDFYYPMSDSEFGNQTEIALDGEEVTIKLYNKEIYRAECNVL